LEIVTMITLFCIHPKGFNVGNEAIHLGLRHLLYEAFGEVINIISLPAVSHYESQAKAGLTARVIHEINQYGHGVVVGGGNLYENGELSVDLNSLRCLEPPLMLFSLSRGRIYNRSLKLVDRTDAMPEHVVRALNERAEFSLARDEATLEYLHGIGCQRAELGGCPTVFLNAIASQLPPLPAGEEPGVLLSIRNPPLMNIPLKLQAGVRDDVAGLVQALRKLNLGVVRLLCHDHRDIPFAASFRDVDYVYTGDVYSYLSLLKSCRLSVSFRLHATLPCLSFGTPSLKISYDERASSLLKTLGLEGWNTNLVNCQDLVGEVLQRYEQISDLLQALEPTRQKWQQSYEGNLATLSKFAADVRACKDQQT
jgi:polysaccharide pyruvyl transferase WcaK-like protein